jgi:hypothetical protein
MSIINISLIKNIIKYINSDNKLKGRRRKYNFYYQDIFNHLNRKYNLKILQDYHIEILLTFLTVKIYWNTMEVRKYNFHTSNSL